MQTMISVDHLTQDYGSGRGVFDVSLNVSEGECYGFLGPNGAGKTTTIRHLMGFSKPQDGSVSISGRYTWKNSARLQNTVGYIPGEVALPLSLTGTQFLRMMGRMRGVKNDRFLQKLLDRFQLDPHMKIKRMSLGVKRKLAIVTAFMHDPDILILDEPTSGLDPVMQSEFIDFIMEEKSRGKTIFLSSHIFHEVDASCDRIAIIRSGRIVSEFQADDLKKRQDRIYRITFKDDEAWTSFSKLPYQFTSLNRKKCRVRVQLPVDETAKLLSDLSQYPIADFVEIPFTLEDYFMSFYTTKEDTEQWHSR